MTNEQLANRLMGQVQFNDALDETCRALMEEAAEKLREKPAASTPVAGDDIAITVAQRICTLGIGNNRNAVQLEIKAAIEAALAQDRINNQ